MTDLVIFAKLSEGYSVKRFLREASCLKLKAQPIAYEDLRLKITPQEVLIFSKKKREPLQPPKMVIFRVAGQGVKGMLFVPHRGVLINEWLEKGTQILNAKTYLLFPRINKLLQNYLFYRTKIPFLKSQSFCSLERVNVKAFEFPVIVKNTFGSSGQKVFKADSPQELKNLLVLEKPYNTIIQPFLPTGYDFRVLVLGGKALPKAMKKTAPQGEFLTNFSQGGNLKAVALSKELKTLAEKASQIFNCDFCGIDIMYDKKGKPHVLEVNRGAQFEGFEKITGLNVARAIIIYLQKKII